MPVRRVRSQLRHDVRFRIEYDCPKYGHQVTETKLFDDIDRWGTADELANEYATQQAQDGPVQVTKLDY